MDAPIKLLTVGVIAERLGTTPDRIAYLIRTRRIKPASIAGNARLFRPSDVAFLRHELNKIDAKHAERKGGNHGN